LIEQVRKVVSCGEDTENPSESVEIWQDEQELTKKGQPGKFRTTLFTL